jgi:DNA-binding GntR family transcriptional regulator
MTDRNRPIGSEGGPESEVPLGKAARSLPEQLAERLLRDIVAGRLTSGDRLKELSLAQEHAVSRATVREALIILAQRGHVEHVPRFGARVTPFSPEDAADLFELRAALLGVAAARCAADPAAPSEALDAIVAEMERLAADPATDPLDFTQRAVAAQTLLVERSGNRYLPALYEQLANMSTWRLLRGRASGFLTAARRQEAAEDWRQIETAIRRRDVAAAAAAARRLLRHSSAVVGALPMPSDG